MISFRLAIHEDVSELEKLIPLSVRTLQAGSYTSDQMDGALGSVFAVDSQLIRDGTYFVAEAKGAIVGCGGWSRRKTMFGGDTMKVGEDLLLDPMKDPARIRAFFVRPGWERRGIGSQIMRLCEEAVLKAGFGRIETVATLVGEHLYANFGYSVVERYDVALKNGHALPVVRMQKGRCHA